MPDFLQQQGQDPDAIRKAILLRMFGGMNPGAAPGMPGGPGATPAAGTPPTQMTPPAAKPIAAAPANNNGGAVEPGNQPPTVLSESDWQKQNPMPEHTPYQAPSFKQRLLTGLFAGMQEYGRPGEGAATVRNYLDNIQKQEDAETNYPTTSAAAQHQKYMTYIQGQRAPLDLTNLQADINDKQAQAKERLADAQAKLNPPDKLQHYVIDDPAHPGQPKSVNFNQKTGAYIDPDTGLAIPGAKPWEKPAEEKNLEKVTVIGPDKKPHIYGVDAKGNTVKDFGVAYEAPKESRSDKSADQVERETRVSVRKAQEQYRGAQATADMQREFIKEAKGGNKAAVKIVPLEGALEITTSQGVHRINRTEVEQYGGAGSLYDRIVGKIGKGLTGKDIPDNILDDMDKMTQEVENNAYKRYSDTYDDEVGIAQGYGVDLSKKLPRLAHGARQQAAAGGAGAPGALPPGWK